MGHQFLELLKDIWSLNSLGFLWAVILGVAFFLLKKAVTNPPDYSPPPRTYFPPKAIKAEIKTEAEIREEILKEAARDKERKKQEKGLKKVYYVLVAIAIIAGIGLLVILVKRLS